MDFDLKQALPFLSATPGTLRSMLGGLSDEWTASNGDMDDWQPYDVVGHLIHCEETDWILRARLILRRRPDREGGPGSSVEHPALPHGQASASETAALPVFEPFDRFAQFEKSKGKTIAELLAEFEDWRARSLAELRSWNLTDEQLGLQGMHPELGEVTLSQLLATWVVHDLTHIRQISRSMARKYNTAVGPWKEYLSILK